MALFYHPHLDTSTKELALDAETTRHVVKVLRMREGDEIQLTNGEGLLADVILENVYKNSTQVRVQQLKHTPPQNYPLHLGIGFTRNNSRNEWMLEKITELGCSSITPLITQHSVKTNFKRDRWQGILTSAMLQSQQTYLPQLADEISFEEFVKNIPTTAVQLLAHCDEEKERQPLAGVNVNQPIILAIGPEGDFSFSEIDKAIAAGFIPITLGSRRLRTETAVIASVSAIQLLRS